MYVIIFPLFFACRFLNDVLIVFSVPLVLVYVVVPILFTVAPDFMQHAFFLSFGELEVNFVVYLYFTLVV